MFIAFFLRSESALADPRFSSSDSTNSISSSQYIFQSVGSYFDSVCHIRNQLVLSAYTLIGTPYSFSGSNTNGFDCSGFTSFVFSLFNMMLPRSAFLQSKLGDQIDMKESEKGDLLFFGGKSKSGNYYVSHVGIVLENNGSSIDMIHSSSSSGVRVDNTNSDTWKNYWSRKLLFVKRVIN